MAKTKSKTNKKNKKKELDPSKSRKGKTVKATNSKPTKSTKDKKEKKEKIPKAKKYIPSKDISNLSMSLFGAPYQFPKIVDPRVKGISSKIGKNYLDKIMYEAPVCTIIPGIPSYLPGKGKTAKFSTALAYIEAASDNFNPLKSLLTDAKKNKEDFRLFDFKSDYTNYMNYVNVLCRAGATFLDIRTLSNKTSFGGEKTFQSYDWKAYRWNERARTKMYNRIIQGVAGKQPKGHQYSTQYTKFDDQKLALKDTMKNYNYVQFFIDPNVSSEDNNTNNTETPGLLSMIDTGSSALKDISFLSQASGLDLSSLAQGTATRISGIGDKISSDSALGAGLKRIINIGKETLVGHNIIFPEIYKSSSYSKEGISITVHLKTPYATKLGYYLDIYVPMMHLLALALPMQETSNSYASPFLVKGYIEGVASVNLGIVSSISISRVPKSRSIAGLPSEVDVTLRISDLYANLMLSPATSPFEFINNASLIEYIATNCGLDLTSPTFESKWKNAVNTSINAFKDIKTNIPSLLDEKVNELINSVTSLIGF